MLSKEIRDKLSQLNRGKGGEPQPTEVRAIGNRLEDIVPGRVHKHEAGECYICEHSASDFHGHDIQKLKTGLAEIPRFGHKPEEVLFLDIETCGLANCPLFLIGVMYVKDGEARLAQLFARDYSEEQAVLAHLAEFVLPYRALVTFNGKSFDVPYIRDRMVLHRVEGDFAQEHFDLLIQARRLWRNTLPNCQLQTLEEHICGRKRLGDTPGHLIPELYHNFVRTGNALPLEGIFHHNALDLITMGELLKHLR